MKKLTRYQKKWIALFTDPQSAHGISLLMLLLKLNVLNKKRFLFEKDHMIDTVQAWQEQENQRRYDKERRRRNRDMYPDEPQSHSRAPRSIKPTRARF